MEMPNKSNGEHYNLRWNSYTNNLVQVLLEHQHHESLVDVTLCCEGQFIKAHKLVLSACSVVFQDMFKVHTAQYPIIILNGIKFNHFKHILEFIYQGEVKVLDIDLEGVLALGESLQVKGLSSIKLKQQASSDELKTTALRKNPNIAGSKLNSVPNSPNLKNHHNSLNTANISSPKDFASNNPCAKSSGAKLKGDAQKHTSLKKLHTSNIYPSNHLDKNVSRLENVLTDPNDSAQRKRFKPTEEQPSAITNGNGLDTNNKIRENTPDTEKNSRPANAFMIFANEWRKKLRVEHPDDNNKAISLKLGNMWKSLTNETKQFYYSAARKMELDQTAKETENINKADTSKKKKVARRRTIDSISHLVSVDLQEFDDDDDLQIIEVNEDPLDASQPQIKRSLSPENTNNT